MNDEERERLWNPDGLGLRGHYSDRPFDILAPETGREGLPSGEDAQQFTQPGPMPGSSPNPSDGGGGFLARMVVVDAMTGLPTTATAQVQGKVSP